MRKRRVSLTARKSKYGLLFVTPWIFGFILFFLIPLLQSVLFSLSKVTLTPSGFETMWVGLENYRFILFEQADYIKNFKDSILYFIYSMPIILVLSLILAVILNQKFKGRLLVRAVFFLPVIIATGVVMSYLNKDMATSLIDVTSGGDTYVGDYVNFSQILMSLGLPKIITSGIVKYIQEIFNLIWNCGVQIILFIAGLQSIPDYLYEVAHVEGATAWEKFWFITFPMLSNVFVLILVFTSIEILTSVDNGAMSQAYTLILNQQNYDQSSSMMWFYFLFIAILISLIITLVQRLLIRKWE